MKQLLLFILRACCSAFLENVLIAGLLPAAAFLSAFLDALTVVAV
jgi:Na+/H+ antiporter NhaB